MNVNSLFLFDYKYRKSHKIILGIDEVGRGCCAGPLVVVGVILKDNFFSSEIKDSKKIKNIKKREELSNLIIRNSISCRIKIFSASEVDILNPKQTSIIGMKSIAKILYNKCDIIFTDYEKLDFDKNVNITKGDSISYSIACASIVAKSFRDRIIERINKKYPDYNFISNQGYFTKKHKKILLSNGPIKKIHRFSYKSISIFLKNNNGHNK